MSDKKYYRVGLRQHVVYMYDVIVESTDEDTAQQTIDWLGWEDHMYRMGTYNDAPETMSVDEISADEIEDLKQAYGDWCNVVGE
jgi:hypothetical protein